MFWIVRLIIILVTISPTMKIRAKITLPVVEILIKALVRIKSRNEMNA